jgi:hypothetical protein
MPVTTLMLFFATFFMVFSLVRCLESGSSVRLHTHVAGGPHIVRIFGRVALSVALSIEYDTGMLKP